MTSPMQDSVAPSPSTLRRARLAVSLVFFANGAGIGFWITHIPVVRLHLGLDERALGFALLAMALGSVVSMSIVTRIVDRIGSRAPTLWAGIAFCALLSSPLVATTYVALLVALFVFGMANGAMDVSMNVHASRVETAMGRPILSSFHGLFSLGALAGSGASSLLLTREANPVSTMLIGTFALAPAVLLAGLGLLRESVEASRDSAQRTRIIPPRTLLALGALAMIGMMSEGAVADWSGVYLNTVVGMTIARAGATFTLLSLTATLGRLFVGDRAVGAWGRRAVLVGSAGLASAGMLVALAMPAPLAAALGLCVAWLGMTSFVPILFSAAGNQPDIPPAIGMGAVATLGYVGFLLGPPFIGMLAHNFGLRGALATIPTACIAVATCSLRRSAVRL